MIFLLATPRWMMKTNTTILEMHLVKHCNFESGFLCYYVNMHHDVQRYFAYFKEDKRLDFCVFPRPFCSRQIIFRLDRSFIAGKTGLYFMPIILLLWFTTTKISSSKTSRLPSGQNQSLIPLACWSTLLCQQEDNDETILKLQLMLQAHRIGT